MTVHEPSEVNPLSCMPWIFWTSFDRTPGCPWLTGKRTTLACARALESQLPLLCGRHSNFMRAAPVTAFFPQDAQLHALRDVPRAQPSCRFHARRRTTVEIPPLPSLYEARGGIQLAPKRSVAPAPGGCTKPSSNWKTKLEARAVRPGEKTRPAPLSAPVRAISPREAAPATTC